MTRIGQERCVACRADSPYVTDEEVAGLIPQIPLWELIEESGIQKLRRCFRFRNFAQAMAFSNQVGNIAEEEGHHPRLSTEWGQVDVIWWTHTIKGLHRNDFIMAAKTDRISLEAQVRTGL
jgi:4a-hydroxytetrahydrobiopterin dehydratase